MTPTTTIDTHYPTSLADYESALAELLADTSLDRDSRAAALRLLARDCASCAWRNPAAGRALTASIEASIDRDADALRGLDALAASGRLQTRVV